MPTKKILSLVIQEKLKLFSIDVLVSSRVCYHKKILQTSFFRKSE